MAITIGRITLSDRAETSFDQRAKSLKQPLELVVSRHLDATCTQEPGARQVVVDAKTLEALEQILGGGSVLNPGDLLKKVQRLAGISFLHVRLPFTPNQLELLAEKAARNSLTVDQLVERTAPRIYEQFFDLVERSR